MRLPSWLEIPAFLALAAACAWVSNSLAGPTRRLSWRRREPSAPVAVGAPPRSAPTAPAVVLAGPAPIAPISPKAALSVAKPAPAAPPAEASPGLLERFPVLVTEAEAELSSEDALWLQVHGARFVDARRTAAYQEGHIPGAWSLPAWEDGLAEKVDQLALLTPDQRQPVVVYCAGGDCHDSHLVAQKLWMAGFRNLRIYTGGFPDWQVHGRAVAKGEKP